MGYTAPHHGPANSQYIAYFCGEIFGVENVAHDQILFIPKGKENIAGVKKSCIHLALSYMCDSGVPFYTMGLSQYHGGCQYHESIFNRPGVAGAVL